MGCLPQGKHPTKLVDEIKSLLGSCEPERCKVRSFGSMLLARDLSRNVNRIRIYPRGKVQRFFAQYQDSLHHCPKYPSNGPSSISEVFSCKLNAPPLISLPSKQTIWFKCLVCGNPFRAKEFSLISFREFVFGRKNPLAVN